MYRREITRKTSETKVKATHIPLEICIEETVLSSMCSSMY